MTTSANSHGIINTSAGYFTYVQVIIFQALFFFNNYPCTYSNHTKQ